MEVTSHSELQKQLQTNPTLLALFYASWCPFCRSFLRIFDKYATQPDALKTLKVRIDEDENPLWTIYGFEAVPAVILFEKEQVKQRLDSELGEGLTETQFQKWLKADNKK
jgi:thiol-disulfide isomerase/thioredoxin